MIIAGTGHRPDKLLGYTVAAENTLIGFARYHLAQLAPEKVISGMALGWDQALAQAALDLRIPLIAAVPFDGFGAKWARSSAYACTVLLCRADEVHIVSDTPGAAALQKRNEWMVDRADAMLALWDGSWGGTFNCLEYAKKRRVRAINLWPEWQAYTDPEIVV